MPRVARHDFSFHRNVNATHPRVLEPLAGPRASFRFMIKVGVSPSEKLAILVLTVRVEEVAVVRLNRNRELPDAGLVRYGTPEVEQGDVKLLIYFLRLGVVPVEVRVWNDLGRRQLHPVAVVFPVSHMVPRYDVDQPIVFPLVPDAVSRAEEEDNRLVYIVAGDHRRNG